VLDITVAVTSNHTAAGMRSFPDSGACVPYRINLRCKHAASGALSQVEIRGEKLHSLTFR